jgi:hypothetical protein
MNPPRVSFRMGDHPGPLRSRSLGRFSVLLSVQNRSCCSFDNGLLIDTMALIPQNGTIISQFLQAVKNVLCH